MNASTQKYNKKRDSIEDRLERFDILRAEANTVREKDKALFKRFFKNFHKKKLNVGIGFQRAYGSILSGDYFDLIKLPDDQLLFVFTDISGHGLPAYTTLIRLRSAITIGINSAHERYKEDGIYNTDRLVKDISQHFTDIMEVSKSDDFACVNFTFLSLRNNQIAMKFYNRSMLFPIIMKKRNGKSLEVINLNLPTDCWEPVKSFLLSSHLRNIFGDEYLDTPSCEFTIDEGDAVLFYSDGIIEAYNAENLLDEFGDKRVEEVLHDTADLFPQSIINELFNSVYEFIGNPEQQKDDMTAVLIDFPVDTQK